MFNLWLVITFQSGHINIIQIEFVKPKTFCSLLSYEKFPSSKTRSRYFGNRAVNNFSNIANMKLGSLHFNHRGCEPPGEGIREHSPPRKFFNLDAWRSYFQHSSLFSLIQSVLKTSPESCLAPLSETLWHPLKK